MPQRLPLGFPRRLPLRAVLLLLLLPVLALLAPDLPAPAPVAAQAPAPLIAYRMTDQWPEREVASAGLFQSPIDLDVAPDGTVLVADRGIGGVHRLLPTGVFTTPFGSAGGFPAQLGQVGAIAVGPAVAGAVADRVFVVDPAVDRLVVYGLDGRYIAHWSGMPVQSVAAHGGRVYVLDREASAVRLLDATTGTERARFGARGTEDGQFANFSDVDVTEDGKVLAVADLGGLRVQLWDLADDAALAGGAAAARIRTVYNLTESRYNKTDMVCRAPRVNALGGDRVFIGQGEQACLVEGREVIAAIATSANKGTICRATVRLPRLRPGGAQFFALASVDPNAGACGEKKTDLETSTVIARYNDEALKGVRTVWTAADNITVEGRLLNPGSLTMPAPDRVFVRDNSPYLRFYGTDGALIAATTRDTSGSDQGTEAEVTRVGLAIGAEVDGEIYAQYTKTRRSGETFTSETGVGRFRPATVRTQQGDQRIIEPVWTKALVSSGRMQRSVFSMAYNTVSRELLVMRSDNVDAQRTVNMVIYRYSPDGTQLDPVWDLPDDGQTNPYVDLAVGPDGRFFVLDDLADKVLVYASTGELQREVKVAGDSRSVAGGPDSAAGSVFTLREYGSIERYGDDGAVTARLDGRAVDFSDPTAIADMVVDAAGKVYVADAQASLVSVFEATDDPTILPMPDDGACSFLAQKTAAPAQIQLGETVTISMDLAGKCGIDEEPTDIVFVVPYLLNLQQGRDRSGMTINSMLNLARRLKFDRHRVGIVSYYQTHKLELPLTSDLAVYTEAVRNITRQDPPNADVKPHLGDAMEEAAKLFETPATRRQVMVLLNAAYCDPNNQRRPVDCTGFPLADDVAVAIRGRGIRIVAMQSPAATNLASSDEDVVNSFEDAHRRIVAYHLPGVLASGLTVVDELPANMALVAGQEGGGVWVAPRLSWQRASLGLEDRLRLSFQLRPTAAGIWPTNVQAYADLTDGWGVTRRIAFPVPQIEVIGPTPVPTNTIPGPTATQPPTATATAIPGTVFLPFLGRGICWPKHQALDIVLVLDASSSMEGAKLQAALAAMRGFLGAARLAPGADQAALVIFADTATVVQGLTSDAALMEAAVGKVTTGLGTRIDRGLTAALDLLAVGGRGGQAQPVVVLLSDGRQDLALDEARAAGRRARDGGVEVYTVGLSQDVDADLLRELASQPDHFVPAADAADLSAVYADIAGRLTGCP
ncbi:MAG: VWA domain-containing protein [Ardenticatenia bacterium]|nr:VWA domain-containing protein [Ardenticatenia bacterium]